MPLFPTFSVTGTTGLQGQTGLEGPAGAQGATGVGSGGGGGDGATGIQGVTGISGVTGFYGQTGIQGVTGIGSNGGTFTEQITWDSGLGAITHVLGPTDQDLLIAGNVGRAAILNGGASSGNLLLRGGLGVDAATAGGNIQFYTAAAGTGTTHTERMRIDSDGRIIVGKDVSTTATFTATYAPNDSLSCFSNTDSAIRMTIATSANSAYLSSFASMRARGSLTSLASVSNGDAIGQWSSLSYVGAAGSGYGISSLIVSRVDGTPSATSSPGRLEFWTTASASLSPTERLRIQSDGLIYIGNKTGAHADVSGGSHDILLAVRSAASVPGAFVNITCSNNTSAYPAIYLNKARGTSAAPTSVADGDVNALIQSWAYFSGWAPTAHIQMVVDGTPSVGSRPGRIVFATTPAGSGASVERMRIDNGGSVTIGETSISSPSNSDIFVPKNTFAIVRLRTAAASATYPGIVTQKSNGTLGSPTAVASGDAVGAFVGAGYIGATSTYNTMGAIYVYADGTPTDNSSAPGRLTFFTTTSGALTVTEKMRINSAGVVEIGNGTRTTLNSTYSLVTYRDSINRLFNVACSNTASDTAEIYLSKSRGTSASLLPVQSGDTIGRVIYQGGVATGNVDFNSRNGAEITAVAEEAFTTITSAARLGFYTTPSGSTTPIERMRITSTGVVNIGAASTTPAQLNADSYLIVFNDGTTRVAIRAAGATAFPNLIFSRARGTLASSTALSADDSLGAIYFGGARDTNSFAQAAAIAGGADAAWSLTSTPSRLTFSTNPTGSAQDLIERARITSNGVVLVGDTTTTTQLTTYPALYVVTSNNVSAVASRAAANSATIYGGFFGQRSRGTSTAPTALQSGDLAAQFVGQGYIGATTGFASLAAIGIGLDGAPVDGSASPGHLRFQTAGTTGLTVIERWRLTSTGAFTGMAAGSVITWTTGLGTIDHITGPTDQNLALTPATNRYLRVENSAAGLPSLGVFNTGAGTGAYFQGQAATSGTHQWVIEASDSTAFAAGVGGGIIFSGNYDGSNNQVGFASLAGCKENGTSGNQAGYLQFVTHNGTTADERWRIASAGALTGYNSGSQVTWTSGLGAIDHILGPTDQDLNIAAGATDRSVTINGNPLPQVISVTSVDLTAVAATNLYTVPTGRTLIVTGAVVKATTATSANGDAVAGIGVAAGEDDILSSQTLTGLNATTEYYQFPPGGTSYAAQAADVVKFGVDTGDTGTALVADVYLIGYLI